MKGQLDQDRGKRRKLRDKRSAARRVPSHSLAPAPPKLPQQQPGDGSLGRASLSFCAGHL